MSRMSTRRSGAVIGAMFALLLLMCGTASAAVETRTIDVSGLSMECQGKTFTYVAGSQMTVIEDTTYDAATGNSSTTVTTSSVGTLQMVDTSVPAVTYQFSGTTTLTKNLDQQTGYSGNVKYDWLVKAPNGGQNWKVFGTMKGTTQLSPSGMPDSPSAGSC